MSNPINKARYWVGVLYPENMREDWQDVIGDVVQVPYAYCCHSNDKDSKSEHRKDHVHLILAFSNTTTYQHAMDVYGQLSADNKKAINTCQAVINIRNTYDYLIHDTETCRKQGKELYEPSARITGNNFDIGSFEQLSTWERNEIVKDLCDIIVALKFTNFVDFFVFVRENFFDNTNYFEVVMSHSALFERLTKGNYQKFEAGTLYDDEIVIEGASECVSEVAEGASECVSEGEKTHQTHTRHTMMCPYCGSEEVKKNGVTSANIPRYRCKRCAKSWILQ